jgi:mRNA-degrading endonuclease RelE of RelBE toxin-antitoxin system
MKIRLTQKADKCIKKIPFQIRKKFVKQLNLLAKNINHPYLRIKKNEKFRTI